jgi:branched-chain amino acid aminotransferase
MHVFLNGEFVPQERALIPADDRGFLYGDALFETLPFYGGIPFRWAAHMARLEQGLKFMRITLPHAGAKLEQFATELVNLNSMPDCVLRLTVSRGSAPRGYSIKLAQKPRVLMTLHPLPAPAGKGWRLITSSLRVLADDPVMQFKTCSRIRSVLARAEAEEQQADEALLLNERGEIAEGAATNVFWIDGQTVCSPPLAAGILPGVTRGVVFELCRARQIEAVERSIQPDGLHEAEAVFLTVSTAGIVEAISLNGKPLRRHPIIVELKSAYWELVAAETKQRAA